MFNNSDILKRYFKWVVIGLAVAFAILFGVIIFK